MQNLKNQLLREPLWLQWQCRFIVSRLNQPLTILRDCVDSGVEPTYSGAQKNSRQTKEQKTATRRKKLSTAEKKGRRKGRKN
mmetsp:Transcript_29288/g.49903  ORF Transcript_29288/g.49903 Transcript_29288/m.49903 type:complete len:82 (-) Transcript_29288:75-320(-)